MNRRYVLLAAAIGLTCGQALAQQNSVPAKPQTNVVTFSTGGSYTPSPGMVRVDVYLIGGGGGGGGGARQASGSVVSGGGGGGGAGGAFGSFTAVEIGASQT